MPMRRKPVWAFLSGWATLPILLLVATSSSAGWMVLSVPIASGAGRDVSTAETSLLVMVEDQVDAINAETTWRLTRHPGDVILLQDVVPEGDRADDIFTLETPDGEVYDLHFDITPSFGTAE
jgi:hypothetical protein